MRMKWVLLSLQKGTVTNHTVKEILGLSIFWEASGGSLQKFSLWRNWWSSFSPPAVSDMSASGTQQNGSNKRKGGSFCKLLEYHGTSRVPCTLSLVILLPLFDGRICPGQLTQASLSDTRITSTGSFQFGGASSSEPLLDENLSEILSIKITNRIGIV